MAALTVRFVAERAADAERGGVVVPGGGDGVLGGKLPEGERQYGAPSLLPPAVSAVVSSEVGGTVDSTQNQEVLTFERLHADDPLAHHDDEVQAPVVHRPVPNRLPVGLMGRNRATNALVQPG